jgi:hypothetical protein
MKSVQAIALQLAPAHWRPYFSGMCNLYSMTQNREAILRLFRISDNRAGDITPQPSIFPAYTAPVVRKAADGERELIPMSWSFVLLQDGKASRRVTNVRDDKILTSRFWKPSFEQRRCPEPCCLHVGRPRHEVVDVQLKVRAISRFHAIKAHLP